jgi:hypothetical protein
MLRGGLLKRRFVALSLHSALGALERKSLLFDVPPQLILAETDTGFFEQMRIQASQRPKLKPYPRSRGAVSSAVATQRDTPRSL